MPKTYKSALDRVFAVLSDPIRRSMIDKLRVKEYAVMELSEHYDISFQAVSKHLQIMEKAGLIHRRREGKKFLCSYNEAALEEAVYWISKNHSFWKSSFDSLESFLNNKSRPDI